MTRSEEFHSLCDSIWSILTGISNWFIYKELIAHILSSGFFLLRDKFSFGKIKDTLKNKLSDKAGVSCCKSLSDTGDLDFTWNLQLFGTKTSLLCFLFWVHELRYSFYHCHILVSWHTAPDLATKGVVLGSKHTIIINITNKKGWEHLGQMPLEAPRRHLFRNRLLCHDFLGVSVWKFLSASQT